MRLSSNQAQSPTSVLDESRRRRSRRRLSRQYGIDSIRETKQGQTQTQEKNTWGICDVEDCCEGARYLVKQKLVDGKRLTIDGGSAGGFTTLAALAFDNVFTRAVASTASPTWLRCNWKHTSSSRAIDLDQLIAPWPGPKGRPVYDERSPINHVDKLKCSVIFFQGDEDKIVPPNQSETMYEALKKKGITTSYVLFEGEQHGFRKKENVIACLEGELYFFGKVLGFQPADDIKEPPKIDNL
ncbi:dipeptidyl aminopeptidase BIII-like isoform X2 [Oscarella lobularis]|uniref:dipeptidyl aminopeptidase BIII-like isoform X2 n=1 Tax=Oscarella lobularis TaxID=121494 RepID=UPI00331363E5